MSCTATRVWTSAAFIATSALTFVEARAGLGAAHRARRITEEALSRAKRDLAAIRAGLAELRVIDAILAQAEELAERESLRGYDAVHLSSAMVAAADLLVTADAALLKAAERWGLGVVDVRT
jgi:uncharacterized protein